MEVSNSEKRRLERQLQLDSLALQEMQTGFRFVGYTKEQSACLAYEFIEMEIDGKLTGDEYEFGIDEPQTH